MPNRTRALQQDSQPPAEGRSLPLASLALGAAAFALAELLAAILIGGFFAWGRAEALLFLALRPWIALPMVLLAAGYRHRDRVSLYAMAVALSALSQSLLLIALGAANPWPEALRGLFAGAVLILLMDLVVQLARRLLGRWGSAAGAIAVLLLLILPFGLRPYEAVVLGRVGKGPIEGKPELMLMSALPLAWHELGPLHPGAPAGAYRMLEREFAVRPLDLLDERSLRSGRLLLIAQPRALQPTELVALDDWMRRGGRALILTDPMLAWPSELALGDFRRPPAIGLLAPLLDHWRIGLAAPDEPRARVDLLQPGEERRRLVTFAPGSFTSSSPACATSLGGLVADCRIGKGRAILLADADMLHDRLWVGSAASGAERHTRIADNPLIVGDYLDLLAGQRRDRIAGTVAWADPAASKRLALLLALLPILAAATPGLVRLVRRRR